MGSRTRLGAFVALLAVQVGLLLWFGSLDPAPALNSYPSASAVANDPGPQIGNEVVVEGQVVRVDPVVIETTTPEGPLQILIRDAPDASRGRWLRVFGVLGADGSVTARRTVAVPAWGRPYAWAVSAVAAVWVLVRLVLTWRADQRGLVPRDGRDR